METPTEPLALVMHDYTALQNFWKRYNKVLLDELALEKEKEILMQVASRLDMTKHSLTNIRSRVQGPHGLCVERC